MCSGYRPVNRTKLTTRHHATYTPPVFMEARPVALTIKQKPTIDRKGNITIPGRSGFYRRIRLGNPNRDLTGAALFFEIGGIVREPLDPGVIPTERFINISLENLMQLAVDTPHQFYLIDESGVVPVVKWQGQFTRTGYTEAPPDGDE